jgi:hypothetical protein
MSTRKRSPFFARIRFGVGYDRLMSAHQIGLVPFIDGITRPVILGADGRQYVLDDDGQPIYGEWILIDEPELVTRETAQS